MLEEGYGPHWEAGDELEEITLAPITRLDLIKYAGASGDYNPIHTVDEAAQDSGLPGIIAHGMLTAATIGRLFSPYLAEGYVKDFGARFVGMVSLGDTLRVGGAATGSRPVDGGTLYDFEVYARTDSETVVTGTAGFMLFTADEH